MPRSQPRKRRDPQSLRERILMKEKEKILNPGKKENPLKEPTRDQENMTTKSFSQKSAPDEIDLGLKRELVSLEFYRAWDRAALTKHSTTDWSEDRIPQHQNQYLWEAERNGFARWVKFDTNFKDAFIDSFMSSDPELSYLLADSLNSEFKFFCKKHKCRQYICHAESFLRKCRQKVNEHYIPKGPDEDK